MHSLSNDIVDVWTIEKNNLLLLDYDWHKVLSEEELARANKFHFEKDRQAFVVYHASKRIILANYLKASPHEIVITTQEKGKPFLRNSSLHFNLSHTSDSAMLAITQDNDIGIDIEYIKKTTNFLDIAKRFFHPKEYQQLINIQYPIAQRDYFYLLWTAKEALLKATGEGISAGLDNFHVTLNTLDKNLLSHSHKSQITLMRINCPINYLASLAIMGEAKTIQYHHFNLYQLSH